MFRVSLGFTLALVFAAQAGAQVRQLAFQPSQRTPAATSPAEAPGSAACAATTLTQSLSLTVEDTNSVSCNDGSGIHVENSYYRAFVLSDFSIDGNFDVCSVEIGIESADAGDPATDQPMTVNLYSGPPGFPNLFPGSFSLVGTASVDVDDQSLTLLNVPVSGLALFGQELVVEILTPDGSADDHSFFVGSNNDGENDPSYIRAPGCGVSSPTAISSLDFPAMHIVMNVIGTEIPVTPTNTPTPTGTATATSTPTPTSTPDLSGPTVPEVPALSSAGLALMVLAMLGIGVVFLLRRRG